MQIKEAWISLGVCEKRSKIYFLLCKNEYDITTVCY